MTFKTEEEAIHLANNTQFGLGAAGDQLVDFFCVLMKFFVLVMSKNRERCDRIAKAFRAGIVWINCSQPCFCQAPWGGMKRSGFGRELGKWGLQNYLQVKQVTSYEVKEPGQWAWYIKSKL